MKVLSPQLAPNNIGIIVEVIIIPRQPVVRVF